MKKIGMLTLSTSTKIKGEIHQKVGNNLEVSISLIKRKIRLGEGRNESLVHTSHGQSNCIRRIACKLLE